MADEPKLPGYVVRAAWAVINKITDSEHWPEDDWYALPRGYDLNLHVSLMHQKAVVYKDNDHQHWWDLLGPDDRRTG